MFDSYNIKIQTSNFYINVSNSNFGPLGSLNGPVPDGSNTAITQSLANANRDWRNITILPLTGIHLNGLVHDYTALLNWTSINDQPTYEFIVDEVLTGNFSKL